MMSLWHKTCAVMPWVDWPTLSFPPVYCTPFLCVPTPTWTHPMWCISLRLSTQQRLTQKQPWLLKVFKVPLFLSKTWLEEKCRSPVVSDLYVCECNWFPAVWILSFSILEQMLMKEMKGHKSLGFIFLLCPHICFIAVKQTSFYLGNMASFQLSLCRNLWKLNFWKHFNI